MLMVALDCHKSNLTTKGFMHCWPASGLRLSASTHTWNRLWRYEQVLRNAARVLDHALKIEAAVQQLAVRKLSTTMIVY